MCANSTVAQLIGYFRAINNIEWRESYDRKLIRDPFILSVSVLSIFPDSSFSIHLRLKGKKGKKIQAIGLSGGHTFFAIFGSQFLLIVSIIDTKLAICSNC